MPVNLRDRLRSVIAALERGPAEDPHPNSDPDASAWRDRDGFDAFRAGREHARRRQAAWRGTWIPVLRTLLAWADGEHTEREITIYGAGDRYGENGGGK